MPITKELLELLACPVDKGPLLYDEKSDALYNPRLRRRYPIVDGIPYLLADQAETVGPAEHHRLVGRSAGPAAPDGLNDVSARY
ncbi:Trm112 family protein [Streptomyces sp. NPDC020096]